MSEGEAANKLELNIFWFYRKIILNINTSSKYTTMSDAMHRNLKEI